MPLLPLFFLLSLSLFPPSTPKSPTIDVTFNPKILGDLLVSTLCSSGVSRLLLHDPDPSLLQSLQSTNISVILSLQNLTAAGGYFTDYLLSHVLPFHPRLRISALVLGHDSDPTDLIPAIGALRSSLFSLGLPQFPTSTILSSSKALDPAFPPSAARFKPHLLPLLKSLSSIGSPIFINLFPFDKNQIVPIEFALPNQVTFSCCNDSGARLQHGNPLELMVDATYAALERAGHPQMEVVVAGTGWPKAESGGERRARGLAESGECKAPTRPPPAVVIQLLIWVFGLVFAVSNLLAMLFGRH